MLFIKVKMVDNNPPLKRMPALIYVEDDNGERVLALREVSNDIDDEYPLSVFKNIVSGQTSGERQAEFSHLSIKESMSLKMK